MGTALQLACQCQDNGLVNHLPDMPILGFSNLARDKDMMSKM